MKADTVMPTGCALVSIPSVVDGRGGLAFAEAGRDIPFAISRTFWIYDVPAAAVRGGHAHWVCSEVVFAVHGAFTMLVDDGRRRAEVRLDDPTRGILIPAGIWCELRDFEPDTVLVVLASHPYDPSGYVHVYADYKKIKEEKKI